MWDFVGRFIQIIVQLVPPFFYIELSKYVAKWVDDPKSCIEVGGGTGRFMFELARQVDTLERFCFIEPSSRFFSWAERFLSSGEMLPGFSATLAVVYFFAIIIISVR